MGHSCFHPFSPRSMRSTGDDTMYNSLIPYVSYVLEDGPCAHRVAFLRWCCNGAFSKLFRCSMGLADSGWQHRAFLIPSLLYSCPLCRYDVIQDPVKMAQRLHGGARRSPVRKGKRISNLHVYSCHSESLVNVVNLPPTDNWSPQGKCAILGAQRWSLLLACWAFGSGSSYKDFIRR